MTVPSRRWASPDGRLVATGSLDATARLWDAQTAAARARRRPRKNVAKVPSRRRQRVARAAGPISSGSSSRRSGLGPPGRELGRVRHEGGVRDLAFSPDGSIAVGERRQPGAAADRSAGRWPGCPSRPAGVVAFSPDGRTAVAAGREVRVWPVGGGWMPPSWWSSTP
jgi:WD40 repeat protein